MISVSQYESIYHTQHTFDKILPISMIFDDFSKIRMGPWGSLKVPDGPRWSLKVPEGPWGSPTVPDDPWGSPRVPLGPHPDKSSPCTAACRPKQLEFIPLMANIYGTWAPPAMKVFRLAADMIQAHENISKSSAMFQVMSSINVVLVKRLATCLLMRVTGLHDDNNNNLEEDSDR